MIKLICIGRVRVLARIERYNGIGDKERIVTTFNPICEGEELSFRHLAPEAQK